MIISIPGIQSEPLKTDKHPKCKLQLCCYFEKLYLYPMDLLDLKIPTKANLDKNYVIRFLAAKLYESGKLSLAQAAQMVSMPTTDFAEILSQYGVSLFNYPASEIAGDAANA